MAQIFIRICAALIALRALTNFAKLFQGDDAMLVVFGQILRGGAVALPAALIGAFMLATGIALWRGGRWALPLITAYAVYVVINLATWTVTNPQELQRVGGMVSSATDADVLRREGAWAFVGYCVVALGTTALPAWLLWKQRAVEPAPFP
jgi:hypothetical protein